MSQKKKTSSKKLLTEVELEMMRVLWDLGAGTVSDVQGRLSADRKLAYTSVSTMLRILEQKKMVTSRKEGRGHVYEPSVAREDYGRASVRNLVDKVFGGESVAMVRTLLDTEGLSREELEELRRLIEAKGRP